MTAPTLVVFSSYAIFLSVCSIVLVEYLLLEITTYIAGRIYSILISGANPKIYFISFLIRIARSIKLFSEVTSKNFKDSHVLKALSNPMAFAISYVTPLVSVRPAVSTKLTPLIFKLFMILV